MQLCRDDIYYAELSNRVVRYVYKSGVVEGTYIRGSFRDVVSPLLQDESFFLCGSSIAVNLYYVTMADKSCAVLTNGQRLELPKASCSALHAAWSDYWMKGGLRR